MSSSYARYIYEREGKEIIEDERGFATYLYSPAIKQMYIVDVYVEPQYRSKSVSREYFNKIIEIAKERNCTYILTSVDMYTNGWQYSYECLINDGYKVVTEKDTTIFLMKDI